MDLLSIIGFGGKPRRKTTKAATLSRVKKRLDKKLKLNKIETEIKQKRARLAKLTR